MTTSLWIVQFVLAIAFLLAGGAKLLFAKDRLLGGMPWVEDLRSTSNVFLLALTVFVAWGRFVMVL